MNTTKLIHQKIAYLMWIIAIVYSTIVVRLFFLQVLHYNILQKKSEKNFLREETIAPQRGSIFDCNSKILVANRSVINVYWQGTGTYHLSSQQKNDLSMVLEIVNAPKNTIFNTIQHTERFSQQHLLASDITFSQFSTIMEHFPSHPNLIIKHTSMRYYPHKKLACHILGYLGDIKIEPRGKMGLEALLDKELKGSFGHVINTINSFGACIHQKNIKHALAGQDIYTTLDLKIQQITEELFYKDQNGCCIVYDPDDGSIRSLLSRPAFDPSIFLRSIDYDTWNTMQKDSPFINRALNACYPPASIFKFISLSAALEEDIIDRDDIWFCKGYHILGNEHYHCREPHGILTIQESIAQSCNILFYEIGRKINADILADYAQRFGLGQKTGITIGEKSGLVPTIDWKQETTGERWWPGDTLSAVIGQSYYSVTPIQVARMIGAIFTGYLTKPRILTNEPINKELLLLNTENRALLQECMRCVVTQGTVEELNYFDNITLYAKTGTAQTCSRKNRWLREKIRAHAWFAGYFYTDNLKPLILIILVEHAGTSRVPLSMAKKFFKNFLKVMC